MKNNTFPPCPSCQKIKEEINPLKESPGERNLNEERSHQPHTTLHKRIIDLERRMSEQEQYSRRESMKLVGLPGNIQQKELENVVYNTWNQHSGKNFPRSAWPVNKRVVIVKLVSRRDAVAILRNERKLRILNGEDKRTLNSQNVCVNESLCPKYRKLLGKVDDFYTINGKTKIKLMMK